MDSNIENQLTRILSDLNKVEGIVGSLIADNRGNVLCHNMSQGTDTSLFGPMAHVIISSSKRLLVSADQGEIQRVLVESYGGKALFLHLENTYFVVLMEISANVGLVMVSAKRTVTEIIEITKDIVPVVPVEEESIAISQVTSEEIVFKTDGTEKTEKMAEIGNEISEEFNFETVDKIIETEDLKEVAAKVIGIEELDEILESEELKALDVSAAKEELAEILEMEIMDKKTNITAESENPEVSKESEIQAEGERARDVEFELKTEEVKESESGLPVIKPPISFPKLPEDVKIPAGDKEKSDLILDIYESIFLAMSIGASKIMGVSPARGLIKKFLPLDECKSLLNNVDVKSNSVVDFNKIRENAENIPLNERESKLIIDFSKIITIITENYGKVMGYGAFRGIVRTEFKIINNSYGKTMEELGIKEKIHPELMDLFK